MREDVRLTVVHTIESHTFTLKRPNRGSCIVLHRKRRARTNWLETSIIKRISFDILVNLKSVRFERWTKHTHIHTLKRLQLANSFLLAKSTNPIQKGGLFRLHTHTHTHTHTFKLTSMPKMKFATLEYQSHDSTHSRTRVHTELDSIVCTKVRKG